MNKCFNIIDSNINVNDLPFKIIPSLYLYLDDGKINIELLICSLKNKLKLEFNDILYIFEKSKNILRKEKNILYINEDLNIVGDLNGNFYDLINIFNEFELYNQINYLFLGNYICIGNYSIETLFLILSLKINYPNKINLLRGINETVEKIDLYNLKLEILNKYDIRVYNKVIEIWNYFPLAAIVKNDFFVSNSSIPISVKLNELKELYRLWKYEINISIFLKSYLKNNRKELKLINNSYEFTSNCVKKFLFKNNLSYFIHSNILNKRGYKIYFKNNTKIPIIISINSSNKKIKDNICSIIKIRNKIFNIKQFNYSNEPFCLPFHKNLFEYSIEIIEKQLKNIFNILINIDIK